MGARSVLDPGRGAAFALIRDSAGRPVDLNQLFVDLNTELGATFLIVTHDIGTARVLPDNLGLLFRRGLVMFGPREMVLSSTHPAVHRVTPPPGSFVDDQGRDWLRDWDSLTASRRPFR